MPVSRLLFFAVAAALLMVSGGCGSGTRPELGTVTGRLTLDGKPLTDAVVVFTPGSGGRKSMGHPDQDGKYELSYIRDIKGAKVGPHTVRVTTGNKMTGKPERLPPRYNTQSELTVEVEPGANVFDFDMTSR